METSNTQIALSSLPLGGRILIRSRIDWRVAVVSRKTDDSITLSVASPKGRNYRMKRTLDAEVNIDGPIPYLFSEAAEAWRENFSQYDTRW